MEEHAKIISANHEEQSAPIGSSESKIPSANCLKRLHACLAVLVVVATVAVFSVVLQADFVHWDDGVNIYENPHIKGINAQSLAWMFTDMSYVPRYMPLGWLSLAVDYELMGQYNPTSYHAGNLLLHCLNALLIFFILERLLRLVAQRRGSKVDSEAFVWAAGIGAIFWSIHPLRAEPVAWASARIFCTASLFALGGAAAYLRYCQDEGRRRWLWISHLAYLVSLFTYPIALALPIVLLVMDFYPLQKLKLSKEGLWGREARRAWLEKVPYVLAGGAAVVANMWARLSTATFIAPVSLEEFGLFSRAMQAFYVWSAYLWKTWLPFQLSPIYTALISFDPWSLKFLACALLILGVSVTLLWKARRWPGLLAMWICYLVLLIPMLGLTEHPHHANDRYSYLPGVLWSLVIGILLLRFWSRPERKVVGWACVAVLLSCGFLSLRQASHWHDRESLLVYLTSTIGEHPIRSPQDVLLGFCYREQGEMEMASVCFAQALAADPQSADAHGALADTLSDLRQFDQAHPHYEEALQLRADWPKLRQNYGVALATLGKLDEAVEQFKRVVQDKPNSANARFNLSFALKELGRLEEAERYFEEARQLQAQQ